MSKLDDYISQAQTWETDRSLQMITSEKRAWRIAFIMAGIAGLSALSNVFLFPLKTVEHQIARVDMTTGIVDIQRCTDCETTYAEVNDKYWLGLYVRTREGFTMSEFNPIYRTVGLLSSPTLASEFAEFFKATNPASPAATLGARTAVRTKIRSISFLEKGLATVRFTKTTLTTGARPVDSYWIATIKYRYVNAPISEKDREINPLGFQVTEYRIDPETMVEVEQ